VQGKSGRTNAQLSIADVVQWEKFLITE